jgi:L-ascorbate metabolism protein UlaG (beta-lactamase superfamily)
MANQKPSSGRNPSHDPKPPTDPDPIRVRYVGHATLRIQLDGVDLITDPIFRRRLLHLRRHGDAPGPADRERPDAILLSHLHLDHTDIRSLRELGADIPVVAPPRGAEFLRRKGLEDVTELDVGDSHVVGGVRITATPADHEGRRTPIFGHPGGSVGYEIAGSQKIYFAGDTDLFDAMDGLFDELDLALLPVWGWGTSLGVGHLDPGRAGRAAALLQPRVAVPIHWGTYFPYGLTRGHGHLLHDPPREFAEEVARIAPGIEVRVLEPGEGTEVARRSTADRGPT